MARLVYHDANGQQRMVILSAHAPEATVGRLPTCTIVTALPTVSRQHCRFVFTEGGCEVHDLSSRSGTTLNGRPIARGMLRSGDRVLCGEFEVTFADDQSLKTTPMELPGGLAAMGARVVAELSFVDRAGWRQNVVVGPELRTATIGRTDDCELQTLDGSVSRLHARIVAMDGFVEVVDLDSANRTFVNDAPISRQALKDGDRLRCGAFEVKVRILGPTGGASAGDASGGVKGTLRLGVNAAAPYPELVVTGQHRAVVSPPPIPALPRPVLHDVHGLEAQNAALAEQVRTLSADKEREQEKLQVVVDAYRDRYNALADQSDQQRDVIDQLRDAHERTTSRALELELEVDQSRNRLETHQRELRLSESRTIDLQAQVGRLERELKEAHHGLDLHAFKLNRSAEELAHLQQLLNDQGGAHELWEADLERLKAVLDAKEFELAARDRELENLRAAAPPSDTPSPPQASPQTMRDLVQFRNNLRSVQDGVRKLQTTFDHVTRHHPAALARATADGCDPELDLLFDELNLLLDASADLATRLRHDLRPPLAEPPPTHRPSKGT